MEAESTELAQRVDPHPSRIRFLMGLAGVSLIFLGTVAILASWMERFPGDVTLTQWIQSWRTSWLDSVMKAVSVPGFLVVAMPLVVVVVAFLFLKGMRRESGQVVAVTMVAYFLNFVLKELVARPRPSADLVDTITGTNGTSFPSGHVMHYAAFFGVLLVISAGRMRPSVTRWLVQGSLALALAAIGLSRIYLGAHWPGDVAAGYGFGFFVMAMVLWLWRPMESRRGAVVRLWSNLPPRKQTGPTPLDEGRR